MWIKHKLASLKIIEYNSRISINTQTRTNYTMRKICGIIIGLREILKVKNLIKPKNQQSNTMREKIIMQIET